MKNEITIKEAYLYNNSCFKLARPMQVRGLMLHSIGCAQPHAEVFARRWNDPAKEVAVHGFIDGITGKTWQFLPWDVCGWHAGGTANLTHIGVEMGEPETVRYHPSSAVFDIDPKDMPAAAECARRTYATAVELFAYLCKKFELDPTADGVIIGHAEGHARGVASNHGDPEHLWRQLGLDLTMDGFRRDVAAMMAEDEDESPAAPDTDAPIYTVRAGDTLSEIGKRFNIDWQMLAKQNGIADPDLIYIGQRIVLYGVRGEIYTVCGGDTLWSIARRLLGSGGRYREIMAANGKTDTRIIPGEELLIPPREE